MDAKAMQEMRHKAEFAGLYDKGTLSHALDDALDEVERQCRRIADLEALLAGTPRKACVSCAAFDVCLLHKNAVASDEPACPRYAPPEGP